MFLNDSSRNNNVKPLAKFHSKVVNKHNWELKKTKPLCRFALLCSLGRTDNFRQL